MPLDLALILEILKKLVCVTHDLFPIYLVVPIYLTFCIMKFCIMKFFITLGVVPHRLIIFIYLSLFIKKYIKRWIVLICFLIAHIDWSYFNGISYEVLFPKTNYAAKRSYSLNDICMITNLCMCLIDSHLPADSKSMKRSRFFSSYLKSTEINRWTKKVIWIKKKGTLSYR